MIEPQTLLGPSNPLGLPAPFWFLITFKVLGFTLHAVAMNVVLAGFAVLLLLDRSGHEQGQRLAARMAKQMPIWIAFAVNLGIVPLLFTQVIYYQVFYPATILMAWPWMSIIFLLTLAYYGTYYYSVGHRRGNLNSARRVSGTGAFVLFVAISFLFATAFSLMTHLGAWPALWLKTSVGGAPTGVAHYIGPDLWPRWLMLCGLALTTTAVYVAVDTAFFARRETAEYRRWALRLAFALSSAGLIWFALMGSWYVFGTWTVEVRRQMSQGGLGWLTVLTALSPGFPWLLLAWQARSRQILPVVSLLAALAQFGVLALNGASRQIVQNAELAPYLNAAAEPVNTQWSPLLVFLVLFAAGVALIFWMIAQVRAVEGKPEPAS